MRAHLVVLYNHPKDPAAFEKHYKDTHLPTLAKGAKQIAFETGVLVKFDAGSPYYRKAELTFASMDALKKGTSTPEWKAVTDDFPKFATGGLTLLTGEETA